MTEFLLPQPSPEGIAKAKELAFTKSGKRLTDGEAAELLGFFMRFIYLTNPVCLDLQSTHENPTTTDQ